MSRAWVLLVFAALPGCRSTAAPGKTPSDGSHPGYELVFSGNESFSNGRLEKVLEEELAEFDRDGPTRPEVDDAAYSIEGFYRTQGFHEAQVTYRYEAETKDSVRIEFEIRQGPRAIVDKVRLEGDLQYDQDALIKSIGGERAGLLGKGELYFDESAVIAGVAKILIF